MFCYKILGLLANLLIGHKKGNAAAVERCVIYAKEWRLRVAIWWKKQPPLRQGLIIEDSRL
jgi:hypothetical protein